MSSTINNNSHLISGQSPNSYKTLNDRFAHINSKEIDIVNNFFATLNERFFALEYPEKFTAAISVNHTSTLSTINEKFSAVQNSTVSVQEEEEAPASPDQNNQRIVQYRPQPQSKETLQSKSRINLSQSGPTNSPHERIRGKIYQAQKRSLPPLPQAPARKKPRTEPQSPDSEHPANGRKERPPKQNIETLNLDPLFINNYFYSPTYHFPPPHYCPPDHPFYVESLAETQNPAPNSELTTEARTPDFQEEESYSYERIKETLEKGGSFVHLEADILSLYRLLERDCPKEMARTLGRSLYLLALEKRDNERISFFEKALEWDLDRESEKTVLKEMAEYYEFKQWENLSKVSVNSTVNSELTSKARTPDFQEEEDQTIISYLYEQIKETVEKKNPVINLEADILSLYHLLEHNCPIEVARTLGRSLYLLALEKTDDKRISLYEKALEWDLDQETEKTVRLEMAEYHKRVGNFLAELEQWEKLCQISADPIAFSAVGMIYLEGRKKAIPQNAQRALEYFAHANKNGDEKAFQPMISYLYEKIGTGLEKSHSIITLEESILILQELLEPNCSKKMAKTLGYCLYLLALKKGGNEKIHLFKRALDWGLNKRLEGDVRYKLAEHYKISGKFIAELRQWKKLCKISPHPIFFNAVGMIYLKGREGIIPQNAQRALKYFTQAIEMGDTEALYNMALAYDSKRAAAGTHAEREENKREAMRRYKEISQYTPGSLPCSIEAKYNYLYLSCLDKNGSFSPKDIKKLQALFTTERRANSQSQRIPLTQALLAYLEENRSIKLKNKKIMNALQNASDNGSPLAEKLLSMSEEKLSLKLAKLVKNPHPIYLEQ